MIFIALFISFFFGGAVENARRGSNTHILVDKKVEVEGLDSLAEIVDGQKFWVNQLNVCYRHLIFVKTTLRSVEIVENPDAENIKVYEVAEIKDYKLLREYLEYGREEPNKTRDDIYYERDSRMILNMELRERGDGLKHYFLQNDYYRNRIQQEWKKEIQKTEELMTLIGLKIDHYKDNQPSWKIVFLKLIIYIYRLIIVLFILCVFAYFLHIIYSGYKIFIKPE